MKYNETILSSKKEPTWTLVSKADLLLYDVISSWVEKGASVLDLGCGGGDLLHKLIREKNISGRGIEIDEDAIYSCVAKGLSVLHEDLNGGLKDFSDKSFDYVVLYNTFQEVKKPGEVLDEALRVGKKVIAGFPNFAYWHSRFQIFFKGKVPVTASLPYQWYDTPNLHFLSVKDFEDYCRLKDITIHKKAFARAAHPPKIIKFLPNFFAEEALYLISKSSS